MWIKAIIGIAIFFCIVLGAWWFFWPIVEMSYAVSFAPLFTPSHKIFLFIVGGVIFFSGVYSGIRMII